jgi:hypothetical protein
MPPARNLLQAMQHFRLCFFTPICISLCLSRISSAMTLTTPALLFPAISLLLLAYTNRFLVLAQLIRKLHNQYEHNLPDLVVRQIDNLRTRITLMQRMQTMGVSSFLFCALSMFLIFIELITVAKYIFGLSLLLLVISLLLSLHEILISTKAIEFELQSIEIELQRRL